MTLWILMAGLAAVAALAVLVPLYRGRRTTLAESTAELSIYRDQLGELDRDLARGLIGPAEAQAARTEIARRLLKADAEGTPATPPAATTSRRIVALVAIVVIPLAALSLYLVVGSPELPDRPLAARLSGPVENEDMTALIARVENHLTAEPNDGRGWDLIAPVYLRIGRYEDAERAYANAIRLLGSTAAREADLGEAMVRANQGIVTNDARDAFERAVKLDPSGPKARFFLALALGQEGRNDEAIKAWQGLLQGAPDDAPWVSVARQMLARLQGSPPGPAPADVDAASKLPQDQRVAMINGMVTQLAARLATSPDDPPGWAQLIRSYMVLGRKDDAVAALAKARTALAGKSDGLAIVEAEARSAGLIE